MEGMPYFSKALVELVVPGPLYSWVIPNLHE